RSSAVIVRSGRGVPCDPSTPAVLRISATPGPFLRVALGRRQPNAAIAADEIVVEGDAALAARVLTELNLMP
ncbi:MAG TPA: SCP2 sterol-binding domain-containing protein, partial [Candidatus Dormibacteraeota bacterium]|nr:SCP2 sterol-binding domain-containing protein [Candidatus Dormibacteraeota bacterium]